MDVDLFLVLGFGKVIRISVATWNFFVLKLGFQYNVKTIFYRICWCLCAGAFVFDGYILLPVYIVVFKQLAIFVTKTREKS